MYDAMYLEVVDLLRANLEPRNEQLPAIDADSAQEQPLKLQENYADNNNYYCWV